MHHENRSLDDLPGEEWRDVVGHEGAYQVSSMGRIKSLARKVRTWNGSKSLTEMILSQRGRGGYLSCKIGIGVAIHRVVARAFLPADNFRNQVNHKNGIKTDNRLENLEWCTQAENINHAWDTGLCSDETRRKMSDAAKRRTGEKNSCWRGNVEMRTLDGALLESFKTLKAAEVWLKENTQYKAAHRGNISRACNGDIKSIYGYKFNYKKG